MLSLICLWVISDYLDDSKRFKNKRGLYFILLREYFINFSLIILVLTRDRKLLTLHSLVLNNQAGPKLRGRTLEAGPTKSIEFIKISGPLTSIVHCRVMRACGRYNPPRLLNSLICN